MFRRIIDLSNYFNFKKSIHLKEQILNLTSDLEKSNEIYSMLEADSKSKIEKLSDALLNSSSQLKCLQEKVEISENSFSSQVIKLDFILTFENPNLTNFTGLFVE